MALFVVLLRAIGPKTHKVMAMADWRAASEADGFSKPETYVATGNMIVESSLTLAGVTAAMNRIVRHCGLGEANRAIVRKAETITRLVRANPFTEAAKERPDTLGVYFFAHSKPDFGWVADFEGPERLHVEGRHLVVDHGDLSAQKLRLPAIIERRSGLVTARNWNTVRNLAQKCAARKKEAH